MPMQYFFFFLIIMFAGFTQGLSGFGSMLVSLPLLAAFMDIRLLIPLLCLLGLCINISLIFKLRRHIKGAIIIPLLVAAAPGIPVGVHILGTVSPNVLKLLLGLMLVAFSLFLLSGRRPNGGIASWWKWPAGFLSGCIGGSIGANGPPIIAYVTLQPWPKDVMKSTMVAFFLISGIGICAAQAFNGLITPDVLTHFAAGLPALLLGVFIGHKCYSRINEPVYRRVITVLLLCMGIFMVAQGTLPLI